MTGTTVAIDAVVDDPRCQSRTGINLALVHEYAEAVKEGADLPPLLTIQEGERHYLYDGFHRLQAYRDAGQTEVVVQSRPGDVWDAIEASCAVNATHGKRRTPDDTKRAVETILQVMAHRGERWGVRDVADKCAISKSHAARLMNDLSVPDGTDSFDPIAKEGTTVTRNGSTYEMNTANIGKYRAPDLTADDDDWEDDEPEEVPYEVVDRGTGEIMPPMSRNHSMSFAPAPPPVPVTDSPDARAKRVAQAITEEYGREQARRIANAILSQGRGPA